MIKNITFGGITRIPSAKIIEQGECSESMNVQIDNGEIVTMPEPELVNAELGIPIENYADILYLHKGKDYLNVIVAKTEGEEVKIGYYKKGAEEGFHPIFTLAPDDKILDIVSVGNTLVFSSNKTMYYVLFKGGEYELLGNKVPVPDIKIKMKEVECTLYKNYNLSQSTLTAPWATNLYHHKDDKTDTWKGFETTLYEKLDIDSINEAFNNNKEITIDDNPKEYDFLENLNSRIASMSEDNEKNGIYNYPIWVTVGFRLFDETSLCLPPILLGSKCGKSACNIQLLTYSPITNPNTQYWGISFQWNNAFKIYYEFGEQFFTDIEKWKDIILSVDIYTSLMIGEKYETLKAAKIDYIGDKSISYIASGGTSSQMMKMYDAEIYKKDDSFEDLYINQIDNLYLKKRLSYKDISKQTAHEDYEVESENFTRAGHVTSLETLKNATFISSDITFADMLNLNNRVIAYGKREQYKTTIFPFSHQSRLWTPRTDAVALRYAPNYGLKSSPSAVSIEPSNIPIIAKLLGYREHKCAISYDSNINKMVMHSNFGEDVVGVANNYLLIPCTVFMIPMSQATSIDISADLEFNYGKDIYTVKGLELKEHPYWPCKYYGGEMEYDGKQIFTSELPIANFLLEKGTTTEGLTPETEKNFIETTNKLYLSEVDSPFSFPVENNYTLPGDIIGMAAATTALSEGQFGSFPLYVFTTQGVYAMSLNSEGRFSSANLVTREIAYKDTIATIDQAVVFVSDKGVMLLTGSQIKCLSSELDGKTFVLDDQTKEVIKADSSFSKLADVVDNMPFLDFIKECQITYDYVNSRIILVNPNKCYQYVYRLDSGTWHKMSQMWVKRLLNGTAKYTPLHLVKVLNSYPDAYITCKNDSQIDVYNFSTRLVQQEEFMNTSKGLIVTRPIDCDNPNGYDALKRIRVRGIFQNDQEGKVAHPIKYLVLASNDGVNFTLLHSTRGGSWKYFRLVVLSELKSTDRLSYITLETEQRYNNKVR